MKILLKGIVILAVAFTFNTGAFSQSVGASADDAIAMVKKAASHIKKNGKEKAFVEFADVHNAEFHDRDLYISVLDMNGTMLAHGNNSRLIGKNLIDQKDVDGKFIAKSLIEIAKNKEHGWVDYKWPNPTTQAITSKSSYVEKVDDMVVIGGIYRK